MKNFRDFDNLEDLDEEMEEERYFERKKSKSKKIKDAFSKEKSKKLNKHRIKSQKYEEQDF